MARIFFMAFENAGQYVLIKKLRNVGHKLVVAEPRYPDFDKLLRQQVQPPELIVCDSSKLPSHARESCNYIRGLKPYRDAPIIFYNVKPEDEAKTREKVPGVILVRSDDPTPAIDAALQGRAAPGQGGARGPPRAPARDENGLKQAVPHRGESGAGAMGRIANSWETTKQSWRVLKLDKELILFPVISGLASIAILVSFFVPAWYSGLYEKAFNDGDPAAQQTISLFMFGIYFVLSFITIFFNAALIHAARTRLSGGDPNVWTGLAGAGRRIGKILLWSIFAATVSLIIHALENATRRANNFIGHILVQLLGTAWTLLTYFVIPVVLFEEHGVFGSLKRSGQLFKQKWGESLIGQYGIGFVFGIMGFVVILITGLLVTAAGMQESGTSVDEGGEAVQSFTVTAVGWVIIAIGASLFLLVTVVGLALGGVYKAALYHYAAGAGSPPGFDPQLIQGAYRPEHVSRSVL